MSIKRVKARQIFDSRGNPTVEADVETDLGIFRAGVPSGASTGKYEALELRDGDKSIFLGKGVLKAIQNVNTIINDALVGWDPTKQKEIDKLMVQTLDGTQNEFGWCKNKLGANAILAVSLAVARAGAATKKIPLYEYIRSLSSIHHGNKKYILPCPSFNVINGGKHGGNGLAIQEFMIIPTGARSFSHAMQVGVQVYHHLMKIIKSKYGLSATNVGDEGGFVPNVNDGNEALQLLKIAIDNAGHSKIVEIGMDCAASQFFIESQQKYDLHFKDQKLSKQITHLTNKQLNELYQSYSKKIQLYQQKILLMKMIGNDGVPLHKGQEAISKLLEMIYLLLIKKEFNKLLKEKRVMLCYQKQTKQVHYLNQYKQLKLADNMDGK